MPWRDNIEARPESLTELLNAQCADLEELLTLARDETEAAASGDFSVLLQLVGKRAVLGERLEACQRRFEELRTQLGHSRAPVEQQAVLTQRAASLIVDIQKQDERTRPHLVAARQDAVHRLQNLSQAQKSLRAYYSSDHISVACSQLC